MHGVRKIPLSVDQKVLKQREREDKLRKFVAARDAINAKISKGEYDEVGLQIATEILLKNPDYGTLWNYRRIAIENLTKNLQKDEPTEGLDIDSRFFTKELELTAACLMEANPKSYGAWHHRMWTLRQMKKPDLKVKIVSVFSINSFGFFNKFLVLFRPNWRFVGKL